jgi:hypothetical protein
MPVWPLSPSCPKKSLGIPAAYSKFRIRSFVMLFLCHSVLHLFRKIFRATYPEVSRAIVPKVMTPYDVEAKGQRSRCVRPESSGARRVAS